MKISRRKLAALIGNEIEDDLVAITGIEKRRIVESAAKIGGSVAAAVLHLPRSSILHMWSIDASRMEAAVDRMLSDLVGASAAPLESEPEVSEDARVLAPVSSWAGPVASSTFLEKHHGIARSTLYRWQKRNEVIALRTGGRKHVFPLEQFVDGRPADHLHRIIKWFPSHRMAWLWLVEPNEKLRNRRPIDDLKRGYLDQVIRAIK